VESISNLPGPKGMPACDKWCSESGKEQWNRVCSGTPVSRGLIPDVVEVPHRAYLEEIVLSSGSARQCRQYEPYSEEIVEAVPEQLALNLTVREEGLMNYIS
jgi:hypothetical protein